MDSISGFCRKWVRPSGAKLLLWQPLNAELDLEDAALEDLSWQGEHLYAEIDSLVNFKPLRWDPLSPLRTGPWFFCLAKSYGKAWQIFGKSTCRVHTGCTWDKSWEPLCLQFLDANIKCVASLFRQLGPKEVASVDKKYEWKPEFKNWPSSNCRNANSVAWRWWKFSVKNLVSADQAMQGQTAGCGSLCRCVCVCDWAFQAFSILFCKQRLGKGIQIKLCVPSRCIVRFKGIQIWSTLNLQGELQDNSTDSTSILYAARPRTSPARLPV